tara:strand:+ start:5860 stop:6045 length:186 start_codon:yes stop_codon:yes gene_type:complete
MNYPTLAPNEYRIDPEILELIFNNTYTSYQVSHTELSEIVNDLNDQNDRDHRNYLYENTDL